MNPAVLFRTPEDVVRDPRLSDHQKVDVLLNWAYDEQELAVVVNEGMGGPEPQLLGRISSALNHILRAAVSREGVARKP